MMTFNPGLEGVVAAETILSEVDGDAGRLILRGHRLADIAGTRSLEWLIGTLWTGFVDRDLTEATLRRDLGRARVEALTHVAPLLPAASRLQPIEALRYLLAAVPDAAPDLALRLTATMAVGLAAVLRQRRGEPLVPPDASLGHAADFLHMLRGDTPSDQEAAALQTYLLTAAEHGLNASTFTARVVASTQA